MRYIVVAWSLLAIALGGPAAAEDSAVCTVKEIQATHRLIPYPLQAQRAEQQGSLSVAAAIGQDGVPIDVTVTKTSDWPILDDAATSFIKANWRWQAFPADCKETSAQVPINVVWLIGEPPKATEAITMLPSDYPPSAVQQGEMGDSYVHVSLDDGGMMRDIRIVYTSGYTDLDEQALAMVKSSTNLMTGKQAGTHILKMRWANFLGREVMVIIGVHRVVWVPD